MPKIRRGGYIFFIWQSDHPPRHVHVYCGGRLVVKWDLQREAYEGQCITASFGVNRNTSSGGPVVKVRSVKYNNRKKSFEVAVSRRVLPFPYVKAEPQPTLDDPIRRVFVDKELGGEGFTYVLESGREGTVHIDQVLEYSQDPSYFRDALLYKLTLEAKSRLKQSKLSKREIIRRLGTSATQFYRLLDAKNYQKSMDQMLALLHVLDCEIDLVVRTKGPSRGQAA